MNKLEELKKIIAEMKSLGITDICNGFKDKYTVGVSDEFMLDTFGDKASVSKSTVAVDILHLEHKTDEALFLSAVTAKKYKAWKAGDEKWRTMV